MQDEVKVLVGDVSAEFGMVCKDLLTEYGYNVMLVPKDGNSVVDAIREFEPDVVVMESFMPQIDAIGIMQYINHIPTIQVKFIVVSSYDNKFIEKEIFENGASYYMLRPLDIRHLCKRIISVSKHKLLTQGVVTQKDDDNLESIVTDSIKMLGVPAHVKGYHYIRKAIMLSINNPDMISSITKLLYPTVAREYSTTSSRVERAIRHAIEIAWDRAEVETLNSYFGYTINASRGKPTNSEFIAMVSDKLRIKLKKTS